MYSVLNNEDGNILIKSMLINNHNFMVGRVGLTEIITSFHYDKKIKLTDYEKHMLSNNAGVYGDCYDEFLNIYIDSISSCDLQVEWDIPNLKEPQNHIYNKYCKNSTIISNRSVEPFYFNNPWSLSLKDKKILVINPFSNLIKKQFENRLLIWTNGLLPNFNLITYKNIQSIGNEGPHKNWVESLNFMKNEIEKIDFDIALLGCGAYGMPLGSFIKNKMKKTSIYIGGSLQILFGIKGKRWDNHEIISKHYNNYWIRPLEIDKPNKFNSVEGGCYW